MRRGATLWYIVVAKNNGPAFARNVILRHTLQKGLRLDSIRAINPRGKRAESVQGVAPMGLDGLTHTIPVGNMEVSQVDSFLVLTTVGPETTSPIVSEAQVVSDETETVLANNVVEIPIVIVDEAPKVVFRKTLLGGLADGAQATYRLSAKNIGNAPTATPIVVITASDE